VALSAFTARIATLVAFSFLTACSEKPAPPPRATTTGPTPDSFRVAFETSRGTFVVQVMRAWAPTGADRFHELAEQGFFDGQRFFRVVPGFVAQFGVNGNPKVNEPWDAKPLADDSVRQSNARGTITYAKDGPRTRTHHIFISLGDNARLDKLGFVPFGRVVEGMNVVDSIYSVYREKPDQQLIQTLGNSYLNRMFPKLDYIKTATIR
jgi:peptidyl-prolyl cis-trans isomerase A (cyclophilin A)